MKYYPIEKIDNFTRQIVDLMPPLEEFFANEDTIEPYSKNLHNPQTQQVYLERQKVFLELIQTKLHRIFNATERKKIKILEDSSKGLEAGVMDHHGILNDPILFGTNIVINYYRMFDREKNGDMLTFGTGNVPLNDPFHRRGFMIEDKRVILYKKEEKNNLVFQSPVRKIDYIESLKKNHFWHLYSQVAQKCLLETQDMISNIDFSGCEILGDQIVKINFYLWPLFFEQKIRSNVSNLISLEYDDLVIDYLIFVLENTADSFISRMLLDIKFRDRALEHFEGATGAWNKKTGKGSHFFWAIQNNQQVRLTLADDILKSADGAVKLEWNKQALIEALKRRQILPCMLLKFSLIIFYMGLWPFTGYGSTNYITVMQRQLSDFLETDFPEEVDRIRKMKVNNMTSIPVVLRKKENLIENYFAFDVIKDGGLPMDYLDKINKVPLKYFLAPRLDQLYEYAFNLYGKGAKSNIKITSDDCQPLFKKVF